MLMSRPLGHCAAPIRRGWATVLYVLAETLRHLGILTQPFVPDAAGALLDQLGVPTGERSFADLATPLPPGRSLPAPRGIFPRFVDTEAAAE